MARPHDLPQRDSTTARLFLAAALLWPLCLWALFTASAPTPVDRRLSTNTTAAASLQLSFRNVLDRVDVVGYGPTHPRVAAVVVGDDITSVQRSVDSVLQYTTHDRVFCVVAVLSQMESNTAVEKRVMGTHPPHKVHVLFGDNTQHDAVSFIHILSKTHEEEGLKSPEEDLILLLLQSGTQFKSELWLKEVTQALIVPPPLVKGQDKFTVAQKLANSVALDQERVAFDAHMTPLVSAATAAEIAASNGASWSAPVAWAGIALRLPTYLNLPIQQSSVDTDVWVKQVELSLQLWLCGDGVDSLRDVYLEGAPPLPTEPATLASTAHVAKTFMDTSSQKLWFSTYQKDNSEVTLLDWETALSHAASEPGFTADLPSRCRSLQWYGETVNQDIMKVWEVVLPDEEGIVSSVVEVAVPTAKSADHDVDGPNLSVPLHPPPPNEEDGPDLSVPIHDELKKPNKPLCPECLEIIQKAKPYDIKFVDVSGGHKEHPHLGALDVDGKPGFIYDETTLRQNPPPPLTETFDATTLRNSCTKIDNNYRMLHEKVYVDMEYEKQQAGKDRPKLFCLVYTVSPNHGAIPNIRTTWAPKCDGFMVASNKTDTELGTVNIIHEGPEVYKNIWQKVRSMWSYVYDNYYDKYDFFHIGGDDLYLLVENLRQYLESEEIQTAQNGGIYLPSGTEHEQIPLFLGRRFAYWGDRDNIFNSGGSGYTMNKAALKLLVVDGIPNMFVHLKDFSEDTRVAQIFKHFSVFPYETKDEAGGERYMPFMPGHHYGYRMPADKKKDWYASYSIDIKEGADHCAAKSVAFHYVKGFSMIRLHALLYGMCPADAM